MKTRHIIYGILGVCAVLHSSLYAKQEEEKLITSQEKSLERRQKVELMGFFALDPKDAKMPKAAFSIELYNKAVEYFQKQEFELARQALKDSLAQDDMNSYAYELLGEIDYRQQHMKDAKANFEIAYALDPRKELKEKIAKTSQETQVESKLSTYNEEHFIIKYHDQEKNVEGFELRELLRETYRMISQEFGYYFRHQVVVLLYDKEEFTKITEMPHWVAGLYDGKVRMPISPKGFKDKELKALTAHEVTHAFIAAMSAGYAPPWINEGLAEFIEDKVRSNESMIFKAALKTGQLIKIDALMNSGSALTQSQLQVALFYEQSFELVRYLVNRYGIYNVKQILGEYAKGKNSDEAIREILKISPQKLEAEWIETMKV